MIAFTRVCRARAGLFFVKKKSGALRLICDGRAGNLLLPPPPPVRLATAGAFSELRLPDSGSLYVASLDVENAFYNFAIPEWLGEHYCLDPVPAGEVGLSMLGESAVAPDELVFPYMSVLPMGCSWAVYWCQEAHLDILRSSGVIVKANELLDFQPAPLLSVPGGVGSLYLDNEIFMGLDPETVNTSKDAGAKALRAAGLPVHEEEHAAREAVLLGWHFDGVRSRISLSSEKRWEIMQAIDFVLSLPRVSPKELMVLVGHLVFAFLVRRPLLSVLRHVYKFCRLPPNIPRRLWHCVRRELQVARALLPLAYTDLKLKTCPTVYCSDSSGFAWAAHATEWKPTVIDEHLRWSDRWRWKAGRELDTRLQALGAGDPVAMSRELEDKVGDDDLLDCLPELPVVPIPVSLLASSEWRSLMERRWKESREPIHVKEFRATLWMLRRLVRSSTSRGLYVLMLTDNMGNALAVEKGRATDPKLLGLLRRWAAYSLAGGCRVRLRWIPSEHNPSDAGSRGKHHSRDVLGAGGGVVDEDASDHDSRPLPTSSCMRVTHSKTSHPTVAVANGSADGPLASSIASSAASAPWAWHLLRDLSGRAAGLHLQFHGSQDTADCEPSIKQQASDSEAQALCGAGPTSTCGSWRPGDPGVELCDPEHSDRLPEERAGVHRVLPSFADPAGAGRGCQPGPGHLLRAVLLGVPAPGRRREAHSSSSMPMALVLVETSGQRSSPGAKGMAQNGSDNSALAPALGCGLRLGNEPRRPPPDADGSCDTLGVRRLPSAGRGLDDQQVRCVSPGASGGGQHDLVDLDPLRGSRRSAKQDRPVQRQRGARLAKAGVSRSSPPTASPARDRPEPLRVLLHPVGERVAFGGSGGGSRGPEASSVPAPSQRALHRCGGGAPHLRPDASSRAMGGVQHDAPLREALPAQQAVVRAAGGHSQVLPDRREAHRECASRECSSGPNSHFRRLRQAALSAREVPRLIAIALFVEVFAGSAHLARAAALRGFHVVAWDIAYSSKHDLTKRQNRINLIRLCLSASYVHFGIPCNTFSRARRPGGGPPPLRSNKFLWGFPDLQGKSLIKVNEANIVTKCVWNLVCRLRHRGIPGSVENPLTSMLWLLPVPTMLLKHPEVQVVRVDFCGFGTPWKKPTRVLSWHFPVIEKLERRCSGKAGLCSFTHDHHVVLQGRDANGIFRTRVAQPYPTSLCRRWIALIIEQMQISSFTSGLSAST